MSLNDLMHKCEYLNTDNIYIYKKLNPITKNYDWILSIIREANEEDLERNSIYENIGDPVWRFESKISYCPYCGEKLSEPKKINCLEDTGTTITDSSEWCSRIL